jgi:hypothetical protein
MMQPAAAATAAIMLSSFPSQNRFVTAHTPAAKRMQLWIH